MISPIWLVLCVAGIIGGGMLAGCAFTMALYAGRCSL